MIPGDIERNLCRPPWESDWSENKPSIVCFFPIIIILVIVILTVTGTLSLIFTGTRGNMSVLYAPGGLMIVILSIILIALIINYRSYHRTYKDKWELELRYDQDKFLLADEIIMKVLKERQYNHFIKSGNDMPLRRSVIIKPQMGQAVKLYYDVSDFPKKIEIKIGDIRQDNILFALQLSKEILAVLESIGYTQYK